MIDITASSPYATDLAWGPTDGPPLLVGVGLIHGLTLVLSGDLVARDPAATSVTVSCLVGLGENYGEAGRDWTYGQLGRHIADRTGPFRNFSEPESVDFPACFGRRPAWRFDLADRALLPEHVGVAVTTRYRFDSRLAGRARAVASAVPAGAATLRRLNRILRRTVGGTAWWAGGSRPTPVLAPPPSGTGKPTAPQRGPPSLPTVSLDSREFSPRHLWELIGAPELITEVSPLGIFDSDGSRSVGP